MRGIHHGARPLVPHENIRHRCAEPDFVPTADDRERPSRSQRHQCHAALRGGASQKRRSRRETALKGTIMRFTRRVSFFLFVLALAAPVWAQNINSVGGNTSWGAVYNVSVDAAGNMYVPDQTKSVIYKVDTLGSATVVAGNGRAGYSGDGALATDAQLNAPLGAAIAPDGTLYIAD